MVGCFLFACLLVSFLRKESVEIAYIANDFSPDDKKK